MRGSPSIALRAAVFSAALGAAYLILGGHWVSGALVFPFRALAALAMLALAVVMLSGRVPAAGRLPAATPRRRRVWLDCAATSGLVVAVLCVFFWLLVSLPRGIDRIAIAAEPWLRPDAAAARSAPGDDEEDDGVSRPGNWLWSDHLERQLPQRTNLRMGNRPEVFLRINAADDAAALLAGQVYVSAFALSVYRDGTWAAAAPEEGGAILPDADGGWSILPVPAGRENARAIRHEVFHAANVGGQNVLTALQGVVAAGVAPLQRIDDGFFILPAADGADGFDYPAISRPLTIHDLPDDHPMLPAARMDARDPLVAPSGHPRVAAHLADTAASLASGTVDIATLRKIESWLHGAFDYSLETTNPNDLDPLENFLFAERRGHCEHFATVGALITRSLGLPSRVAYGWAGGTWYEASRLMVFRSREAHAWTEVLVPDVGWVVMDPTPPPGIDGTRARIAPPEESPPDPAEMLAHIDTLSTPTALGDAAAAGMLALAGLTAVALLGYRAARLPALGVAGHHASSASGHAASRYLEAWHAACPPRFPGETLRRQFADMKHPPPFAAELLDYHYQSRYARVPADAATEHRLAREIQRWRHDMKNRKLPE